MLRRRDPLVHLYSVCWNEADQLAFFFRHYEPWVQRFVIYDNGSTDATISMLSAKRNVEIRRFPWSDPDSFVNSHRALHNACWRESRRLADWVVVTAVDEHLYHPDMSGYLDRCRRQGVTCIPALGYQMMMRDFPDPAAHLAIACRQGVPDVHMNKLRLFDPDQVEPNFFPGGHGAAPTGNVVYPARDELLLLHYKNLGLDYRERRDRMLAAGLRDGDRARDWGRHYRLDRAKLEQHFEVLWKRAVDIAAPGYIPSRDHPAPRFWRAQAARHRSALARAWSRISAAASWHRSD